MMVVRCELEGRLGVGVAMVGGGWVGTVSMMSLPCLEIPGYIHFSRI